MTRLKAILYLVVITALGFWGLYLGYEARARLRHEQTRVITLAEFQNRLNANGYLCGRPDAKWGPKTKAAAEQCLEDYHNGLASKYMTVTGGPK